MKWRLIEQEAFDAPMNMAIDHAIYESVANKRENPTIRFYRWKNNSVSISAYQNPKEVNVSECRKNNVDVVRRLTGGRAVYHDKKDFTYSIVAPIKIFSYDISRAYSEICYCIIDALGALGIKSSLENKNDIIVGSRKISGNASKLMEKGVYLQHGTLVYDLDAELMSKVLNVEKSLVREKATSIRNYKKVSQEKVYDELKSSFLFGKDFEIEALSDYEKMRARDLSESKYSTIIASRFSFSKNKGVCYVERGGN